MVNAFYWKQVLDNFRSEGNQPGFCRRDAHECVWEGIEEAVERTNRKESEEQELIGEE